jgi:hypothetical protein
MNIRKLYKKNVLAIGVLALVASMPSAAVFIDFTGGTYTQNNGGTGVTSNSTSFQNVANYIEDGFKFEFFFGTSTPSNFASIVGDYYNTSNDVLHWHWSEGPFGEVDEVRVSKVDNSLFDLGGFRVSTNTSSGGGSSSGTELVSINTSKALSIFNVDSDDWGLGNGPDPLITISAANTLFDDISWFSFTNDISSTAVGMSLDRVFLDEAGDPNGEDPTDVPEPSIIALLGLGLVGLGVARRRRQS